MIDIYGELEVLSLHISLRDYLCTGKYNERKLPILFSYALRLSYSILVDLKLRYQRF